jgi:hypothetical protein
MFDRLRQRASHPTAPRLGPRRLTWRGVVAGFLLAAALPVALLVASHPVVAATAAVATAATAVGARALAGRLVARAGNRRTSPTGVVDGD